MDKSQEITFIFTLMCEQLDAVAPRILPFFQNLKDGKITDLNSLNAEDISNLIKAFTLYHLLLNIIDGRHRLSNVRKGEMLAAISELREQKYEDEDIKDVLRKIRLQHQLINILLLVLILQRIPLLSFLSINILLNFN